METLMQQSLFQPGAGVRLREELVREAAANGFDGATFDQQKDGSRLTGQLGRVWDAVRTGRRFTLAELAAEAGGSESGVAARLRDLRKPRFGGFNVQRERVAGGLWRYWVEVPGGW